MPRPYCFTLPYARFSAAHVLKSLEQAVASYDAARIYGATIESTSEAPRGLDVTLAIGPKLVAEPAGEDDLYQGTLSVRYDGQIVSLILDPEEGHVVLPALIAIAETMLGGIRDLAAVASGESSDDEEADAAHDPFEAPKSFEELTKRAQRLFSLDAKNEGVFGVTIHWQSPVGRTQGLLVHEHTPRFDKDEPEAGSWVTFESVVCPADRLTPEEALRRSRSLDVGALYLHGELYTIIARYPLRALDRARFVSIAFALAEEADRLEAMLTGGKDEY